MALSLSIGLLHRGTGRALYIVKDLRVATKRINYIPAVIASYERFKPAYNI